MFRCGVCEEVSKPGEKPVMKVTKTAPVTYPFRHDANSNVVRAKEVTGEVYFRRIIRDDPGGTGTRIVKEVMTHSSCA